MWYDTTNPPASINSLVGMSTVFSPVTGGYYGGGSLDSPGYGRWWSTTAYDESNRYSLGFDGSSLYTSYDFYRSYGFYVRCVRAAAASYPGEVAVLEDTLHQKLR